MDGRIDLSLDVGELDDSAESTRLCDREVGSDVGSLILQQRFM